MNIPLDSMRLGRLGKVYYHYASITLHLSWLSRCGPSALKYRQQLETDVLNHACEYLTISEREASLQRELIRGRHAAQLLNYAAVEMPRSVFRFAHNNFFTMLSFACAVLVKVSVDVRTQPEAVA
jgi:hypothetical protein